MKLIILTSFLFFKDPILSSSKRLRVGDNFSHIFRSHVTFVSNLYLKSELTKHGGCVNTIQWNSEGTLLVTGSDDCFLVRKKRICELYHFWLIWMGENVIECVEKWRLQIITQYTHRALTEYFLWQICPTYQ